MPKYFEGKAKLPYPKERVLSEDVSPVKIGDLLAKHGDRLSLCVRFRGLEKDCLGYVFNIKRTAQAFDVSDITRKKLLTIGTIDDLTAMIHHASGAKYDDNWQREFQRLRNQITSDK